MKAKDKINEDTIDFYKAAIKIKRKNQTTKSIESPELPITCIDAKEIQDSINTFLTFASGVDYAIALKLNKTALQYLENHAKKYFEHEQYELIYKQIWANISVLETFIELQKEGKSPILSTLLVKKKELQNTLLRFILYADMLKDYSKAIELYQEATDYLENHAKKYLDKEEYEFLSKSFSKRIANSREWLPNLRIDCVDSKGIIDSLVSFVVYADEVHDPPKSVELYQEAFEYLENHAKKYLISHEYENLYDMLSERILVSKKRMESQLEPINNFMSVPIFSLFLKPLKVIGFENFFKFVNFYHNKIFGRICLTLLGSVIFAFLAGVIFHAALNFPSVISIFVSMFGHLIYIIVFIISLTNLTEVFKFKSINEDVSVLIGLLISFLWFLGIFFILKTNNIIIPSSEGNWSIYLVSVFFIIVLVSRGSSILARYRNKSDTTKSE